MTVGESSLPASATRQRRIRWAILCLLIALAAYLVHVGYRSTQRSQLMADLLAAGGTDIDAEPVGPQWLIKTFGEIPSFYPQRITEISMSNQVETTDRWLERLQIVGELEDLEIFNATPITGTGMQHLTRLNRLRTLTIQGPGIDESGFSQLARLGQLETLTLVSVPVSERGLQQVSTIPNLQQLHFIRTDGVTDGTLTHLGGLDDLRVLSVADVAVTDAGLQKLSTLGTLEELHLQGLKVTEAGLAHLSRLDNLRALTLTNIDCGDHGLETLTRCSGLKSLTLIDTDVTKAGVAKLNAQLPGCTIRVYRFLRGLNIQPGKRNSLRRGIGGGGVDR